MSSRTPEERSLRIICRFNSALEIRKITIGNISEDLLRCRLNDFKCVLLFYPLTIDERMASEERLVLELLTRQSYQPSPTMRSKLTYPVNGLVNKIRVSHSFKEQNFLKCELLQVPKEMLSRKISLRAWQAGKVFIDICNRYLLFIINLLSDNETVREACHFSSPPSLVHPG